MKQPHKHADIIKAWADGEEIEFFSDYHGEWRAIGANPQWFESISFRIKPEPKPDLRLFYFVCDHVVQCSSVIHIHNLILTFDGETGKLKSAEVL